MNVMRYAICNEVYEGWAIADVCQDVADAGYDGIEIAPFTLLESVEAIDESVGEWTRKIAQDVGLEVVGLHWLLNGTKGLHLSSPDWPCVMRP